MGTGRSGDWGLTFKAEREGRPSGSEMASTGAGNKPSRTTQDQAADHIAQPMFPEVHATHPENESGADEETHGHRTPVRCGDGEEACERDAHRVAARIAAGKHEMESRVGNAAVKYRGDRRLADGELERDLNRRKRHEEEGGK